MRICKNSPELKLQDEQLDDDYLDCYSFNENHDAIEVVLVVAAARRQHYPMNCHEQRTGSAGFCCLFGSLKLLGLRLLLPTSRITDYSHSGPPHQSRREAWLL